MPRPHLSDVLRRLELGRLLLGSALELFVKAYGVAAALAVALSDAETFRGKASDAVRAVPSSTGVTVAVVWKVIDYRMQPPPPPSPAAAQHGG